jgi:hypothetical protein
VLFVAGHRENTQVACSPGIRIIMCAVGNSKRAVPTVLLPHIFLLCISGANCAQKAAEPPFTLKQVGPNAWAAIDNARATAPATANAGFVIGDDAVAVIDTLGNAEAAKQLLAEIHTLTKLPVKFVIKGVERRINKQLLAMSCLGNQQRPRRVHQLE